MENRNFVLAVTARRPSVASVPLARANARAYGENRDVERYNGSVEAVTSPIGRVPPHNRVRSSIRLSILRALQRTHDACGEGRALRDLSVRFSVSTLRSCGNQR